eukprot:COSAG05_NODE_458_length_9621_cov_5.309914_10_plen_60_part_00
MIRHASSPRATEGKRPIAVGSLHPLVSKPAFNLHAGMPVESKPFVRAYPHCNVPRGASQ